MFSLHVFCKLPIPDRVKHILDTMELENETELVYVDKIGTPDEYKSIASSAPNVGELLQYVDEEGIFIVTESP
ncbi:hypothetical protein BGZ89_001223 [Linnemannia elongata]|nr:hypothetical protein BGZ89_001223 [Linnemannia elongata]